MQQLNFPISYLQTVVISKKERKETSDIDIRIPESSNPKQKQNIILQDHFVSKVLRSFCIKSLEKEKRKTYKFP